MNNTKIDWADMTWNPVTGCLHGCQYCYARQIANRFGLEYAPKLGDPGMEGASKLDGPAGMDTMLELQKPYIKGGRIQPYPMAFDPTFHRYRLQEPAQKQRGRNIFVVSMGDLFGEWVPREWISDVFKACAAAPQHNYIFLTKNPQRLQGIDFEIFNIEIKKNIWLGFSATTQAGLEQIAMGARFLRPNPFISIEPLHGPIDLTRINPVGKDAYLNFLDGGQRWFMGGDNAGLRLKWVIIGAETGNRKERVIPKREWVASIVKQCRDNGVPIFMKHNIADVWDDDLIQEAPPTLQPKIKEVAHA